MGIKGIYKEIGPGLRQSLVHLAVAHLERTGRPLRLAIDISIWQFQVQAARGGSNPAIRTIFYRLVRLLGHSIQPIFVFDGPNKPAFKRNKRSSGSGDAASKAMAKRLIRLFGFTAHDAPGEAEAECALLQRERVVDAVLSEDVDTIMFGCGMTLRSWSAESKGSTVPTHVTIYDAEKVARGASGLDREGMVLVALMSGGDYIPEGIPGCGVKVACEAARAGFGRSLCRIKKSDKAALEQWKAELVYELRNNEKGYFRTRHRALAIPEDFPNMDVLRYYTHPVVSQQAAVDRLGREFPSKTPMDIVGLREFVRDTFDWTYKPGAVKLIKLLAPGILVKALLDASADESGASGDLERIQRLEYTLVKGITTKRAHFSTGGTPELRISYIPIDMVPLDLDAEPEEVVEEYGRSGLALNSDDEFEEEAVAVAGEEASAKTAAKKKAFDALQPDVVWIPESIVKLGAPLTVEDWEASKRGKEKAAAAPKKAARKPVSTKKTADVTPPGALDKWVKVTKVATDVPVEKDADVGGAAAASIDSLQRQASLPTNSQPSNKRIPPPPIWLSSSPVRAAEPLQKPVLSPPRAREPRKQAAPKQPSSSRTNPWTLAGSQASGARVTKSGSPTTPTKKARSYASTQQEPILISSSPSGPLPSNTLGEHETLSSHPFASSPPTAQSPRPRRRQAAAALSTALPRATQPRCSTKTPLDNPGKKQTSIKAFGMVGRGNVTTVAKPLAANESDTFQFSSSDDEEGEEPPPSSAFQRQQKTAVPNTNDLPWLDDDDDHDISLPDLGAITGRDRPRKKEEEAQQASHNPSWLDDDDVDVDVINTSSRKQDKPGLKRVYIPRVSNVGFFKEVSVGPEEAERLVRTHGRAFRLSDVSFVDLTGSDP